MKVTLKWLKEYVDITLSAAQIADQLTMAGLEVEDIYTAPRPFNKVVIGKVVKVNSIPKSKKLTHCHVDTGGDIHQVVCGAPNVQEGMKSALALPGAVLQGHFNVESREVFGVSSNGMLCSESELGLTNRADGIMLLDKNAPVGKDLNDYLGEQDTVIDIFITPNRPDCLSVIGIAREIAAINHLALKKPETILHHTLAGEIKEYIDVKIDNPERCFRYSGRFIENVIVGSSPYWMAERLNLIGSRSINNIVDITNYIMWETGQPLHAFDYEFLNGKKIIVRTADKDESFVTLDDKKHRLDEETLMICDAERPVALAGIMGGENSEVNQHTHTVFLESAYFEPTGIRKSAKKLDIATESSRRFERGADPNGTVYAMDRAASLMSRYAGGQVLESLIDNYPTKNSPRSLSLRTDQVNRLLGTQLQNQQVSSILSSIGIEIKDENERQLDVLIPTFRPDLERPVDLIEEVARLYGFDNIPNNTSPDVDLLQPPNKAVAFRDNLRAYLAGLGFREALSLSLVPEIQANAFVPAKMNTVKLLNPLSADLDVFRPNLLHSLLHATAYNRNRQMHDLRLFEIGNVAYEDREKSFVETTQLALLIAGHKLAKSWDQAPLEFDFYDIKGYAEALFDKIGLVEYDLKESEEPFWSGQSVKVTVGEKVLGALGKFSEKILGQYKIKQHDVFGLYFDFNMFFELAQGDKKFQAIPKFPMVPFDLALIVDQDVPVGDLRKGIFASGGQYLIKCVLFDQYKGDPLPAGKKSVAFSLTFYSKERTLQDNDIEKDIKNILSHLNKHYGAQLRPR